MAHEQRARMHENGIRLGDAVIGLFCGRWTLMALDEVDMA